MIPADIATRVQLTSNLATQPPASAQKIADALSEFIPGQRLMATIQAILPNGTYRAMIAQQREITLALPFAAKTGDALELEVIDTNGKMALALASNGKPAQKGDEGASVSTRLTIAGRLISELLAGLDKEGGKRPQPAPLNNAAPVLARFPANAAELVPALRNALNQSGMFYESHQAQWVQGKTPLENLLKEPQGRLSPAAQMLQGGLQTLTAGNSASPPGTPQASLPNLPSPANPASASPGAPQAPSNPGVAGTPPLSGNSPPAGENAQINTAGAAVSRPEGLPAQNPHNSVNPGNSGNMGLGGLSTTESGAARVSMNQLIAPNLTGLVQQQLEALASNSYIWQGQIWPGQTMEWEIVEEDARQKNKEENTAANWTTRLRLILPRLGGIAATLKLSGGRDIEMTLSVENESARMLLNASNAPLRQQFEAAGLKLKLLSVARHAESSPAEFAA